MADEIPHPAGDRLVPRVCTDDARSPTDGVLSGGRVELDGADGTPIAPLAMSRSEHAEAREREEIEMHRASRSHETAGPTGRSIA